MPHSRDTSDAVRQSLLDAIERAAQVGLAVVDERQVQTYVNPAFCRMVGFSEEELLGHSAPFVYWPPEELGIIQTAFEQTVTGAAPPEGFELRLLRKDGVRIDVHLIVAPMLQDGVTTGWLASIHDITARKRVETQLAEAQHLASIGSWHWEIATRKLTWSRELYRQYGQDPDSYTPTFQGFLDQVIGEDRARVEEALQRTLEEDAEYGLEIRVRRPDGGVSVQRVIGRLERDESGRPLHMFGTSQDITEQKQDEQERLDDVIQRIALSFSQELDEHRLVQRITDEATAFAGASFGALFFSDQALRGSSFTRHTLSGREAEAFADFPLPRATPLFAPTFAGEIVRADDVTADPRYGQWGPSPDGHPRVVSYLAVPVKSRTGEVLAGLFFGHPDAGRFSERHERLMVALAGHAAIAIDNARLYRQLRTSEEASRIARVNAERTAALLADQRTLLELIANGAPLDETLDRLVRMIEEHSTTSVKGSVLLLDPAERRLHLGAAPNLPRSYNDAIEGVVIGPSVGSCGTAAHDNCEVLVKDIANDPLWADYRELALAHGLRACWSTPIRSSEGEVLGTFALYHGEPVEPTPEERDIVRILNRTASIAIERKRVEDALHDANRRKDEFLALLGHELRNPLAPILTALQLMELRGDGGAKERAAIDRHVRHMMQLVDDLLDISRITRGKLELDKKPLDVKSVLADAAEMAGPLIEERAHHLSIEVASPACIVDGDSIRLAQVFSNLLTNAAKYMARGGRIDVRAYPDDDALVVTVRDTGHGIDASLLPRVFEPFVQGKRGIDRLQGGLGLGLPLVRNLVTLHGGEVTALSEGEGRGTEIRVRLPLSKAVPGQSAPTRAEPVSAEGSARRVLLVDDNKDAALLMADLLEMAGYQVTVRHDGPAALSVIEERRFDAAVVDIGLPVMSGHELGRRLLERQPLRLIAVTGYGQESDRRQSAEAGFSVHLVKPVRYEELLSALEDKDARVDA